MTEIEINLLTYWSIENKWNSSGICYKNREFLKGKSKQNMEFFVGEILIFMKFYRGRPMIVLRD